MILQNDNHGEKDLSAMKKLIQVFSHDLRNPLLNINALIQEADALIQELKAARTSGQEKETVNILDVELPEVLDMLKMSASRMDDMVLGVNDLSHCWFDELECETIEMRQMFLRCFGLLKLAEKGFELVYEGDGDLVYADHLVVQRIVTELLTNAQKAVEAKKEGGSKLIHVAITAIEQHLYFHVADDGCGFKEYEVANVFNPFYTGQGFPPAVGLGLSRVKAWVEHLGGSVAVTNWHHKTVVTFGLPRSQ